MTENYPPSAPPAPPAPPQEQQSTTEVIKGQAADLGGSTMEAGRHTANVAREQASDVVAEATRQGRNLVQEAQGQLGEQVAQGQQRLASELLSISDELRSMAESSDHGGTATELARQAASRARDAGQWLDARGPAEVVDEVQSFARRRPGMFLAIAAGVGLIAGRLTRGIKDASSDNGSSAGSAWTGATSDRGVPSAQLPISADYPPVSTPQVPPEFAGTASGLPASGEGSTWSASEPYVEETYVEETYIEPEPPLPADQGRPEDIR